MTVENLHDAIGQLPSDLIAQVDKLRSRKRKTIPWQRYAAMAACAALVLCASYGITLLSSPKSCDTTAAPEMAMQQMAGDNNQAAPAEAAPMAPMEAPAEAEAVEEQIPTYAASEDAETAASGGHSHVPGAVAPLDRESGGLCGNMTATIFFGDEIFTLEGEAAVALANILYDLPYSEETLCRCSPEFMVDLGAEALYEVSLGQYFVRIDGKQASLTEEEAAQIQVILNAAKIDN